MTSRDAFTRVPKGTTITVNEPSSANHSNPDLDDGVMTVIGCGRKECHSCGHKRKTVLERGGKFILLRSSGAVETFGSGNTLTVTRTQKPGSHAETKQISPEFCKKDLCQKCRSVDFTRLVLENGTEHALFPTFNQLISSSESCPLCAVIASTLVDSFSFQPDESRPVILRGKETGTKIEVSFPSKEEGSENLISERCAILQIYTSIDAPHAPPSISGRLPQSPDDSRVARTWLTDCLEKHDRCRQINKPEAQKKGPTRLVNVGPPDGSQNPRLEEGQHSPKDYLTLSYRWGDSSSITQTTKETLTKFKDDIPFASLSRIFQDAIAFTRSMGIRYIWIDSLCIIQDSPEDQAAELPRMAEIYEASLLTISASTATSGDSALSVPRQWFNLIELSESKGDGENKGQLPIYITNQTLSDFSEDVLNGTLGTRGWCFQERLLASRLLHFGRDQLHWECHEGIWSESSTERKWYSDLDSIDDGELRVSLRSDTVFNETAGKVVIGPLMENATERANEEWNKALATADQATPVLSSIEKRKIYDAWYQAVSAYTGRELTKPSDKLPALAGAAVRFNTFIKDVYVAGIWADDVVQGLLWSRSDFEAVKVDPSLARRPGVGGWGETNGGPSKGWRGAPSWSWASVDGRVHWVRDRHGPPHIGPYALMTKPSNVEAYQGLEWCAIRVRGHLLDVNQLSWLRDEAKNPETQSDFEKSLATLPVPFRPQIDPDDPEWERALEASGNSRPLYCLLICSIPFVSPEGNGQKPAVSSHPLGYALTLRYWPGEGAFRRVGLAKVAVRDFMSASPADIHIL